MGRKTEKSAPKMVRMLRKKVLPKRKAQKSGKEPEKQKPKAGSPEKKKKKQKLCPELAPGMYIVKRINSIQYDPNTHRCKFLVAWKKVENDYEPTWEPIECLLSVPRLIRDLEERMYKDWQDECEKKGVPVVGWKKPLDLFHHIDAGLPFQYVMSGHEKLVKIAMIGNDLQGALAETVPSVDGEHRNQVAVDSYCYVRFRHEPDYHWVHIGFIEYYFPTDLALFLHAKEHNLA